MPAFEYSGIPKYDELYAKDRGNLFALIMHVLLALVQTLFIISVLVLAFVPVWPVTPVVMVGWIWGFTKLNEYLCYPLNGRPGTMQSDRSVLSIQPQPLPPGIRRSKPRGNRDDENLTEKWIFINGVAVGSHWLQSNIDLLSLIFQRPITGVHNRSAGIIFDVIEVLIERIFDYCTTDIRKAFEVIGQALRDPKTKKVVLILHSQGGIQGGLIVDWLLDQITSEDLAKLEIYTFGCAANHFNNPRVSASATAREPIKEAISHIEHYANINDFVARWGILNAIHPLAGKRGIVLAFLESLVTFSWLKSEKTSKKPQQNTRHSGEDARVGYQGRIFELPRQGHMMNQHYLARMFPLEEQNGRWEVKKAREGDGSLMNMKLKFINQGPENQSQRTERRSVQEGEEIVRLSSEIYPFAPILLEGQRGLRARGRRAPRASQQPVANDYHIGGAFGRDLGTNGDSSAVTERTPLVRQGLGIDTGVQGAGSASAEEDKNWPEGGLRMKDVSRLWKYVNGGDPDEKLSPAQAKRGNTF